MANPIIDNPGPGGGSSTPHIDWDTDLTNGLNVSFSAHTEATGHGAGLAFDDDVDTVYKSKAYGQSFNWQTPYAFLQVGFPTAVRMAAITIIAESNDGPPSYSEQGMPSVFQMQVSDDGISWTTLAWVDYQHYPTYIPYLEGAEKGYGLPASMCPSRGYKYFRIYIWRVYSYIHEDNDSPTIVIAEMKVHPYVTL